jgi:hypothetical protein
VYIVVCENGTPICFHMSDIRERTLKRLERFNYQAK